ncbi:hemerythrin domain-containing protein [Sulfurimonas sp. HSL-1716]|uniref:hemerythrin domain-containing protein n=1 Tax=Hydrocurvibacter sulfurireducens TaxID=3131937 RepID=UPI0031F74AB3
MTIKDFMTHHHRDCDQLLAAAEEAVDKKDFEDAQEKYNKFKDETLKHFDMEEGYLFPTFEEKSGMGGHGPTQVMRMEHEQVRMLFSKLDETIAQKDGDRFFGLTESLMILLQQHNAKEEQMLYTMMQSVLSEQNDEIVDKLMNYGK